MAFMSVILLISTLFCSNSAFKMSNDIHYTRFESVPPVFNGRTLYDINIECMSTNAYYMLTFFAVVPFSIMVSFILASHFYKNNMLSVFGCPYVYCNSEDEVETDDSETETMTIEEKYINLYPIKYATHEPFKDLEEYKYTIIIEGTPRGILVMSYNYNMDGFEYWSDSDIPLVMLETAARRYVREYNCKNFYLPRKKTNKVDNEDYTEHSSTDTDQEEKNVDENQEEEKNVDENQQEESNAGENQQEESVFIKRKKTDTLLKLEKQLAEEERATRFIKKGRLLDFKPKYIVSNVKDSTTNDIDYTSFKKAMDASIKEAVNNSYTQPSRCEFFN